MRAMPGLQRCLLVLCFVVSSSASADEGLHLEQVQVITRHGIRVPFPPLDKVPFSAYSLDSSRDWFENFSDWGSDQVAGLTDHGREVVRKMGAHFRSTVLKGTGNSFSIYSSVDSTKRDIKTALSFFHGAFPDANVTEADIFGPSDKSQEEYIRILLNQGDLNKSGCPSSSALPEVIKGENGGDFAALSREAKVNIMEVNDLFNCCQPSLCEGQGNSSFGEQCTLMSLPTRWEGFSFYWEDFTGPMTTAAKLMEYVQLAFLNGMEWTHLVPGMSEDSLGRLMHLHEASMNIADDYWNAQNSGSELLVHLAASMQQVVSGQSISGLHSRPTDSLVYFAAHDINIYLIRRLLRLNWLTDSFNPNQSPPGGMLLFSLYSSSSASGEKSYFVKAFFMSQSMRQQRENSDLSETDPASRVFAVMPGCASGPELSCPFEDFKALVLREIKRECVSLVNPDVLSPRAVPPSPGSASSDLNLALWAVGWLLAGVVLTWALGHCRQTRCFRRRAGTPGDSGAEMHLTA